jgi:hypothetical protein
MPTENNGRNRTEPKIFTRQTPRRPQVDNVFAKLLADFMPVKDAAKAMKLTPATIRKYCQDNVFTNAQAFGKEWVISHEDVKWWVENRQGRVGRPSKQDAA